jgi:hypothetical protein
MKNLTGTVSFLQSCLILRCSRFELTHIMYFCYYHFLLDISHRPSEMQTQIFLLPTLYTHEQHEDRRSPALHGADFLGQAGSSTGGEQSGKSPLGASRIECSGGRPIE